MTGAAPGDSPGTAAPSAPAPAPAAAAEGRLAAGRYRLLRQLGRGGMGVVWLARDELLDREVAVKELRPPSYLPEESFAELRERAMREARNVGRIRHPNAVTLHDVVPPAAADDAVYLIMEFVDGPTLAELIESHGPMPAPWTGALGLQLLDVLQAAHALGIVHRDVKPANILVTKDGQAKLTDFGIAHSATDPRLTGIGVVGTPAYVAPELFHRGPLTPAVDLWSLGATLYHAADGHGPFDRDSLDATIYAIALAPMPVPDFDPGIAAAISAMLCRDPGERATIAQARALLSPYGAPRLPPLGPPSPARPGAAVPPATGVDPAPGGASGIVVNSAPPPPPGIPAAGISPPAGPAPVPAARRRPGARLRRFRWPAAIAAVVAIGVTVGVWAVRWPEPPGQGAGRQLGGTSSASAGPTPGGSGPRPSLAATPRSSPKTSTSGPAPARSSGSPHASASGSVPVQGSSSTPAASAVALPTPAITGVTLDQSDGDLTVMWSALADSGLSYDVHYENLSTAQPAWQSSRPATTTATEPGCTPTKANAGVCTLTTAQLPGLPVGDTFAIYVTAVSASGQSKPSATHYYVGAPQDFAAANRSGVVDLSWVAVSGNSVQVYYLDETAGGTWQTLDYPETTTPSKFGYPADSTQVTGLTSGDRYAFYVESANKYGAGDSQTVTVTPAA